jgi:hypothetical protein
MSYFDLLEEIKKLRKRYTNLVYDYIFDYGDDDDSWRKEAQAYKNIANELEELIDKAEG